MTCPLVNGNVGHWCPYINQSFRKIYNQRTPERLRKVEMKFKSFMNNIVNEFKTRQIYKSRQNCNERTFGSTQNFANVGW